MLTKVLCVVALLGLVSGLPIRSNTTVESALGTVGYPTNYYGVDVSQPVSEAGFRCLVGENLVHAMIRCFQSTGHVDPSCADSVANAHAGGMKRVDAYMFPCPTCHNPGGQVKTLLSYFEAHHVNVDTLWLDIEGTQYWLGSTTLNRQFYEGLVSECQALGLKIGVYTSLSQWSAIFGSTSYVYGNNHPLWYPHYDGAPEFNDFAAFGGWSSPTYKQFSDAGKKCGVSYDINWGPNL